MTTASVRTKRTSSCPIHSRPVTMGHRQLSDRRQLGNSRGWSKWVRFPAMIGGKKRQAPNTTPPSETRIMQVVNNISRHIAFLSLLKH